MHGCCETRRQPSHLCILQNFCCFRIKTAPSKAVGEKQNKTALNTAADLRQSLLLPLPQSFVFSSVAQASCCPQHGGPCCFLLQESCLKMLLVYLAPPHSHLFLSPCCPFWGRRAVASTLGHFTNPVHSITARGRQKCSVGGKQNQLSTRKPAPSFVLMRKKHLSTAEDHPRTSLSPTFG